MRFAEAMMNLPEGVKVSRECWGEGKSSYFYTKGGDILFILNGEKLTFENVFHSATITNLTANDYYRWSDDV